MLRFAALVLSATLLAPLAAATPAFGTDCVGQDPEQLAAHGCYAYAFDPDAGTFASCYVQQHRETDIEFRAAGCAAGGKGAFAYGSCSDGRWSGDPYAESTCRAGTGADGASGSGAGASCARNVTTMEPTKVEVPNLRCGGDVDGDGSDEVAFEAILDRNDTFTTHSPGHKSIDLRVCCADLDGDGADDIDGGTRVHLRNLTSFEWDFDWGVTVGDVDGDGADDNATLRTAVNVSHSGFLLEPDDAPIKAGGKVFTPVGNGDTHATAARNGTRAQGNTPLGGMLFVCCADSDGDGRGDAALRVKGGDFTTEMVVPLP